MMSDDVAWVWRSHRLTCWTSSIKILSLCLFLLVENKCNMIHVGHAFHPPSLSSTTLRWRHARMMIDNSHVGPTPMSSSSWRRNARVPPLPTTTIITTTFPWNRQHDPTVLLLFALTERQLQFWEDVEEGWDAMEQEDGMEPQDLYRIRRFGKSARGEIPFPKGVVPGHEPSEEHIDGLMARPYWDLSELPYLFPWAPALQENIPILQQELQHVLKRNSNSSGGSDRSGDSNSRPNQNSFLSDSAWQNQVMGKGWSAIRLQRLGIWNEDVCNTMFPQTFRLIQSLQIPTAVRGVCFARQAPFSGVQPHSDGRNFILTIHVPLQIPDGCSLEVGGIRRTWEMGKLLAIDTSFQHSTSNPTPDERYVLIIDVWHPELTTVECNALAFVYDLRNKYEQGIVPFRKPKGTLGTSDSSWADLWKSFTTRVSDP